MDTAQAQRLCAACDLGHLLAEPQAVHGGLLHQMWRLTSSRGDVAVKRLHPAILNKGPHIRQLYRLTEQVAATMAAQGIPALAARTINNDPLVDCDEQTFLVYDWVVGETLPLTSVTPKCGRLIGSLLARIHTLHLEQSEFAPLEWKHFADEDWDMLTFQASEQDLLWSNAVRAALPRLLTWSKEYEQAGTILLQTLVLSHRDLDQKNVLWRGEQDPVLIDWEAAGLINPTMELVGVALSWSGQSANTPPQETTFNALLQGYVESGGIIADSGRVAIEGRIGIWLGWLLFNMRRSLGEAIDSEEERQLALRETQQTLATLHAVDQHTETWASWVDRWR